MTLVPAFLTMLAAEGVVHAALARRLLPGITIEPPQDGEAPPRFTEHPVQVPSRP